MRLGVLVVVALLTVAAPTDGATVGRYWSVTKVMRKLDGVRVRAGRRVVRIESDTTLCSGKGRAIRRTGVRRWSRFACTFTTFTSRGVDRDLEFAVVVRSRTRFVLRDVHWVTLTR